MVNFLSETFSVADTVLQANLDKKEENFHGNHSSCSFLFVVVLMNVNQERMV